MHAYLPWIAAILVGMAMILSLGSFVRRDCSFTGKASSIRNADCNGGLEE
jgi:hypothetical protein